MTVTELQALVFKLQSQINQLELTNKGANKALEFRLEAILQANLDTFWLLTVSSGDYTFLLFFFHAASLS